MPESRTERGFDCYVTLKDSYGADVQVVESSAAMFEGEDRGPWVWIMIDAGQIKGNHGSTHLDIRDAVKVRDALSEFIEANSDHLNEKEG